MKRLLHYVKHHYLVVALMMGMAIIFIFLLLNRGVTNNNEEDPFAKTPSFLTMEQEEDSTDDVSLTLMIDVKGAVRQPGIYTFTEGDRIDDAIKRAGGFTEDAEDMHVNLALKLVDEQVIYVPKIGETPVEMEQFWREAGRGSLEKLI